MHESNSSSNSSFSSLDLFLEKNRIPQSDWDKSCCKWDGLLEIEADFRSRQNELSKIAEFCASLIQKLDQVHSVRWRVKDAEHLIAKIIRKKAAGVEKYKDIDLENYFMKITDLVGVRALHLFKDDCFEIDAGIKRSWKLNEGPIAYIRNGDDSEILERYECSGFNVQVHGSGYRSIHYIIESQLLLRSVFVEIQVRTIFEEGWSEIDHRVRYPNFSNNKLIEYFLTIFNRMAGSADEMGVFVRDLACQIVDYEDSIHMANLEKESSYTKVSQLLHDLNNEKGINSGNQDAITQLTQEVERLKSLDKKELSFQESLQSAFTSPEFRNFADQVQRMQNQVNSPEVKKTILDMGKNLDSVAKQSRFVLGK